MTIQVQYPDHSRKQYFYFFIGALAFALLLALAKVFSAQSLNSKALLADGIEGLTDAVKIFLSLLGFIISRKPADRDHPYGHGKAETLFSLLFSLLLVGTGVGLIREYLKSGASAAPTMASQAFIVSLAFIGVKAVFLLFTRHFYKNKPSNLVRAIELDAGSDLILSGLASAAIFLQLYFSEEFPHADRLAAVFAGGWIVISGLRFMWKIIHELMDGKVEDTVYKKVRQIADDGFGIIELDRLHIRKVGFYLIVDLHIRVEDSLRVDEGHALAHSIEEKIKNDLPEVQDVLIHVEPKQGKKGWQEILQRLREEKKNQYLRVSMLNIAIFISGRGSNMEAILKNIENGILNKIRVLEVLSDNPKAQGLRTAQSQQIPTHVFRATAFKTRLSEEEEQELVDHLVQLKPDCIVLAGYMRMIKSPLLSAFQGRIINIHPSLLPKYPGLHTHERVLKDGENEHGCTVHFVDDGMDTGDIIRQAKIEVVEGDTPETLATRLLAVEHQLYSRVLKLISENQILLGNDPQ